VSRFAPKFRGFGDADFGIIAARERSGIRTGAFG
jgi:hypothetical protein